MSSKSKLTIYDLAQRLQISPSTVSRALQNHPRISEKTRKRVHSLAEKLNYQADPVAQQLRTGRGMMIGVIIPHINRNFFSSIIDEMERVLSQAGYQVIIGQSDESLEKEKEILEGLKSKKIDAIAVSLSAESSSYDHFLSVKESDIPLVFFDRIPDNEFGGLKVSIDNFQGAYQATTHLIQQGYKQIAHLAGPTNIGVYKDRLKGYKAALIDAGWSIDNSLIIENCITLEKGRSAAEILVDKADAVFSAGDFSALGMLLAIQEKGILVPSEFGVVGYANESFGTWVTPTLSSVNQFSPRIGHEVAEMLIRSIEKKERKEEETVHIAPELIIRSSSCKKG